MGKWINLTASDGFELSAYRADPEGPSRGGIVIVQEIFGVNGHIRDVCDRYAKMGFVAVAPGLFDRVEPGIDYAYTPELQEQGGKIRAELGPDKPMYDVIAAVDYLMEDQNGHVGVVGFCWGGTLAWLAAQRSDIVCCVAYYGGAIHDNLQPEPKCPMLLHFGGADGMIPMDKVAMITDAYPDIPTHVYDGAGHGFNCDIRASYHEEGAKLAQVRTNAFLEEHMGESGIT